MGCGSSSRKSVSVTVDPKDRDVGDTAGTVRHGVGGAKFAEEEGSAGGGSEAVTAPVSRRFRTSTCVTTTNISTESDDDSKDEDGEDQRHLIPDSKAGAGPSFAGLQGMRRNRRLTNERVKGLAAAARFDATRMDIGQVHFEGKIGDESVFCGSASRISVDPETDARHLNLNLEDFVGLAYQVTVVPSAGRLDVVGQVSADIILIYPGTGSLSTHMTLQVSENRNLPGLHSVRNLVCRFPVPDSEQVVELVGTLVWRIDPCRSSSDDSEEVVLEGTCTLNVVGAQVGPVHTSITRHGNSFVLSPQFPNAFANGDMQIKIAMSSLRSSVHVSQGKDGEDPRLIAVWSKFDTKSGLQLRVFDPVALPSSSVHTEVTVSADSDSITINFVGFLSDIRGRITVDGRFRSNGVPPSTL